MRVVILVSLLATLILAAYTIQDDYSLDNFADMFDFFTGADPTNGYVNYVDQSTAQGSGLYRAENGQIYMGVDFSNVASGQGRDSIRISSKNTYNHGLIILDLAHMPGGQCGTWPAFWLLGPSWPNSGEVDIIEGVNSQATNSMAVHTNAGCSITNTGNFAGSLIYSDCNSYSTSQPSNVGCSIHSNSGQSYGSGFNSAGGGIYATEWTSEAISIWFFPRSAIPSDIINGAPDPSNWGLPSSQFTGACDIDEHIINQQIVFDITFCGTWAGDVWSQDSQCSSKASTCQDYVQNNPSAFQDTFWSINSLKVYQNRAGGSPASAATGQSGSYSATPTTSTIPQTTFTLSEVTPTSWTEMPTAAPTTSVLVPPTTLETSIVPATQTTIFSPDTTTEQYFTSLSETSTQWNTNWDHRGRPPSQQSGSWGGTSPSNNNNNNDWGNHNRGRPPRFKRHV